MLDHVCRNTFAEVSRKRLPGLSLSSKPNFSVTFTAEVNFNMRRGSSVGNKSITAAANMTVRNRKGNIWIQLTHLAVPTVLFTQHEAGKVWHAGFMVMRGIKAAGLLKNRLINTLTDCVLWHTV